MGYFNKVTAYKINVQISITDYPDPSNDYLETEIKSTIAIVTGGKRTSEEPKESILSREDSVCTRTAPKTRHGFRAPGHEALQSVRAERSSRSCSRNSGKPRGESQVERVPAQQVWALDSCFPLRLRWLTENVVPKTLKLLL